MCVKAVPTPFIYVHPDRTWRNGTQEDFDALAKACLALEDPWTSEKTGQQLRDVRIAFARTSPEMFDHLYDKARTLLPSPETLVWVAAKKILDSYWRFSRTPPKPVVKPKKQLPFLRTRQVRCLRKRRRDCSFTNPAFVPVTPETSRT